MRGRTRSVDEVSGEFMEASWGFFRSAHARLGVRTRGASRSKRYHPVVPAENGPDQAGPKQARTAATEDQPKSDCVHERRLEETRTAPRPPLSQHPGPRIRGGNEYIVNVHSSSTPLANTSMKQAPFSRTMLIRVLVYPMREVLVANPRPNGAPDKNEEDRNFKLRFGEPAE